MTSSSPLISVVMPTYNGSRTIKKAIQSVLEQNYSNLEIIIVNDASVDNTIDVVEQIQDKRIKLLKLSENKGVSAARNAGIRASKGEYVAFLDDDDEWLPTKLADQLEYLQSKDQDTWKAVICSHYMSSKRGCRKVTFQNEGDISKEVFMMEVSLAAGSSLMVHKDVVEKIGYIDERYSINEDVGFILKYLRFFKLATMKESLSIINGHSGRPSGERMLVTKEMFLKDFKQDIEQFDKRTVRQIYARQWLQVSKHFSLDGDIKNTIKYYFKSLSFALLFSIYTKVLPLENYLTIPYYLLTSLIFGKKKSKR